MDQAPPPLSIRRASLNDLDLVAPLFDAYRQFYEQAPDAALARRFIAERLERQQSVILLAQIVDPALGPALGFCQLYPSFCSVEAVPIYTLYDLFVAPAGRRRGVARQLLLATEAQARQAGMPRMDLSTARSNHGAQALYASLGWQQDTVFLYYNRRVAVAAATEAASNPA